MSAVQSVAVGRLRAELIPDVVRIHQAGLGYTFNSRLGDAHLTFLYGNMAQDPESYVGVATVDGKSAGVISGTLDEDRLKTRLVRSMSAGRFVNLGVRVLLRPSLIVQWIQGMRIASPVYYKKQKVDAVLTALAVDPECQGHGVGRNLVGALEQHFAANQVGAYRLDTLATNERALRFYADLGFTEAAKRAGSVVLVRALGE